MNDKSWLKSMENGSIGEARAKSFLINRFWILQRSVDIDGVDFMIQRRMTNKNFLDEKPANFGAIQVKFIQDEKTSIRIKKEYILSKYKEPHEAFFLLIFSGNENNERKFLISAKEIIASYQLDCKDFYKIITKDLIINEKFKISDPKSALDKIENSLEKEEFYKNRYFIKNFNNHIKFSDVDIDNDFLLPFNNPYTDIKKAFYQEKEKLQKTLYNLEDISNIIREIISSTNPILAHEIRKNKLEEYMNHHRDTISISCEAFTCEYFQDALKRHQGYINELRKKSLLEPYLFLLEKIDSELIKQMPNKNFFGENGKVKITIKYDPNNLKKNTILAEKCSYIITEKNRYFSETSTLGKNIIYFEPFYHWDINSIRHEFKKVIQKEIDINILGENFISDFY